MTNRVKTGIAELDGMLEGGFLEGDAVMVAGSAGSGKTTLALQYIVNGIQMYGETGIYVTFEQLPTQLYRDALSFGWDLRKMEDEDKLRVVCTSPELLLQTGEGNILDGFIKEIRARRIVIDSLSHILMYVKQNEARQEIYRLVMYLKTKRLSSLLTWEAAGGIGPVTSVTGTGTSFLVDSVVLLKPVEIESTMRKALAILKLRGSDHDKSLREYEITGSGIKVKAPFTEYEGLMTGSARKRMAMAEAVDQFSSAFTRKDRKT